MKKTRKILSVILCLCMIMTTIGSLVPISASAATGIKDGSSAILIANNANTGGDNEKGPYGQEIIDGFAGKDASDKVYKISAADQTDGNFSNAYFYEHRNAPHERYVHKFDFLLEDNSQITLSTYIYTTSEAVKGITSSANYIIINPAKGITPAGFVPEKPLPTSISINEWHNIAIEIKCDGSKEAIIYFDGEAYPCALSTEAYGIYAIRGKISKNTVNVYLDNFGYVTSADLATDLYDAQTYTMADIAIAESDKVSYNEAENQFTLLDSSLTVAELKSVIATDYDVTVYKDKTYSEILADDALATVKSAIVITNGSAFRYYDFYRENTTNFDYVVNSDGVTCKVTGFKTGVTPETNSVLEIPAEIAGYPVTVIGANAFKGKKFSEVIMPDTVETIESSAFYDSYVSNTAWPKNLVTIGAKAFYHGKNLATNFPASLKTIGENAFSFSEIKTPVFQEGLESIANSAFVWCAYMGSFIIPDSVTYLGNEMLNASSAISKLRFPRNSKFNAIPADVLYASASYSKDNAKLFGDVSIYIPETITTIPRELLRDFKDGANIKIYAAYGSAAYQYYLDIKSELEAGTYVNNAVYGTGTEDDPYKDADKDGKGEIASIAFCEYDFEANVDHFANTIQTGETAYTMYSATTGSTIVGNVAGNGGKLESDVVVKLNSPGGAGGHNYLDAPSDGATIAKNKEGAFYNEISVQAPFVSSIGAGLGTFTVEDIVSDAETPNISTTVWNVAPKEIRVNGIKVMDAVPGRWYTIATEVKCDGTPDAAVYINGVKYDITLASPAYGVRHFRVSPKTNEEFFDVYYDNLSGYLASTKEYYAAGDKAATLTSNSDEIGIYSKGIVYKDQSAVYTAGELKAMLETDAFSRANIRIYSDETYETILADDENVTNESIVVVAATNGYPMERTFSYYPINPAINTTLFNFAVISEENKTAKITGFNEENIKPTDDMSIVNIPEKIMGYTIIEIGDNAFKDNEIIESLTLPDTVETIGNYAFAGKRIDPVVYGKIKNIKWPKNLKKIGKHAFSCQTALTEIELPYGVETIDSYAFYWITSLKRVTVPESVTTMGENVFRICKQLEYVKLSGGVKQIPKDIFAGVTTIKTLIIPSGVESDYGTMFDYTKATPVVCGVAGTFAQAFANQHNYKFVGSIGGVISADKVLTETDKELTGTNYDIRQNFKKLYATGEYVNISTEPIDAKLYIALYDEADRMLACNSGDVVINVGKTTVVTKEDNICIENIELKDGYKVKIMLWSKDNNKPLTKSYEVLMDEENEEYHAILIGTSYGNDSFAYINDIAEADDVLMNVYNLYIGGGSLYNNHYKYILNGTAAYQPVINGVYMSDSVSIEHGLKSNSWDYVVLQANTTGANREWFFAPDYEKGVDADGVKYSEYWSTISDKVSEWAPNAKKLTHITWSPSDEVCYNRIMNLKNLGATWGWDDLRNAGYTSYDDERYVFGTARDMFYNAVIDRYEEGNMYYTGDPASVIPSAVAVYLAITKYGFDEFKLNEKGEYVASAPVMYRDTTCHLSIPYGRVLAGLTWYETITGNDVTQNPYQHSDIPAADMAKLKAAAHEACQMYRSMPDTQE